MKRTPWNIVILAAAALAIFAIVVVMKRDAAVVDTSTNAPDAIATAPIVRFSMTGLGRESWPLAAKAEGYIAALYPDQVIQPFVISDPTDSAIVYFATSADTTAGVDEATLLSIYRYNTTSHEFERLYRQTYRQGEAPGLHKNAWPTWGVIGYDDEKLVILLEDIDYSPGFCSHPLLTGLDNEPVAALSSLDLANPLAGLSRYTPPDDAIIDAQRELDACLAELE